MNQQDMYLLEAWNQGYRISPTGQIIGLTGPIKGNINQGYRRFSVSIKENGVRISHRIKVSHLQAYQKFGHALFQNGILVRHLNGNPLDDSWDNIAIGTQSENQMDRLAEERQQHALHAASYLRKYSNEIIEQLFQDRKLGLTYKQLTVKYGIAKSQLSFIFNKASYKLSLK